MAVIVESAKLGNDENDFVNHYIKDDTTAQMYRLCMDNGNVGLDESSETTEYNPVLMDALTGIIYVVKIEGGDVYIKAMSSSGGSDCCPTVEDNNVKLTDIGTTLVQLNVTIQQMSARLAELEAKETTQTELVKELDNGWKFVL